jgi:hypothetical protein
VKLLKAEDNQFVFHISRREKQLLLELLKLYPVVKTNYQPLSKSASPGQVKIDQSLLEEALTLQHQENKRHLQTFLQETERFTENKSGFRFTLDSSQMEWFLQVLNDIRVGNWLALGSPDPAQKKAVEINQTNASRLWAMELSGYFQMVLLEALQ